MAIGDTKLIVHVVIANYRCSMQAGAHVYIVYTYSIYPIVEEDLC